MASTRTFIGIDGCRAGWFCVILDGAGHWSFRLAPDARAVGELAVAAAGALIDIPVGLPDSGPEGRLCDREARRLLGPGRASSQTNAKTFSASTSRAAARIRSRAGARLAGEGHSAAGGGESST